MLLAAGLSLLIVGTWRLVRGPNRRHALACLLLGLPPLGFLAGHLMYGFGTAYGRQFALGLPIKVLMPFGESILDLVARIQYPQRTEGERVVMISKPVDNAQAQVAAMDRHIRALEARLGRTGTRRVHWVRGPLLGIGGKAILGMCMGSSPGEEWERPDAEGLRTVDRHEVAHVVLSQFCTADSWPPAVLMEGWAEAASIANPNSYRLRAWAQREAGRTLTLETLCGPLWYGRHDYPVYLQGAPWSPTSSVSTARIDSWSSMPLAIPRPLPVIANGSWASRSSSSMKPTGPIWSSKWAPADTMGTGWRRCRLPQELTAPNGRDSPRTICPRQNACSPLMSTSG